MDLQCDSEREWYFGIFPFLESGFPDVGALEMEEEGIEYDLLIASQKRWGGVMCYLFSNLD